MKTAEDILVNSLDLCLSTSEQNEPWASPLFFWTDKHGHFYFVSKVDSRHVKNISKNPNVAVSIFDSKARQGIQFKGSATILHDYKEIQNAIYWALIKRFPYSDVTIAEKRFEYEQTNRKIVRIKVDKEGFFVNEQVSCPNNAKFYQDVRRKVDLPMDLPLCKL